MFEYCLLLLIRVLYSVIIHWYKFETAEYKSERAFKFAESRKSAFKYYCVVYEISFNKKINLDYFTILKKCILEYQTKIHESLLIKKAWL